MNHESTLKSKLYSIETAIDKWLPAASTRPIELHKAMRYSMSSGKRLRPLLLLAAAEVNPRPEIDPLPAAVGVECLHSYSLIHDDLPAIDNSDLRRNQPSCHKKFDEPTALLAGDALLTYAFHLLARAYQPYPEIANLLVLKLSEAAGSEQLIGGQMEDILGDKLPIDEQRLAFIHQNKTAALFAASISMGLALGNNDLPIREKGHEAGISLGLAFQILDDILDVEGDPSLMGKPTGIDAKNKKITYPTLFGLAESRKKAHLLIQKTLSLIETIGTKDSFFYFLCSKFLEK
ncbi:MAG: hypothetical protein A2007_01065 [Verrucomicrobia bacterium GWC2_42_7]|nr:MAG: hypothetical protein A2007_01065 [Verrucomicrobia bacterium GWC2_42_7]